jgi:hypothetical protein
MPTGSKSLKLGIFVEVFGRIGEDAADEMRHAAPVNAVDDAVIAPEAIVTLV